MGSFSRPGYTKILKMEHVAFSLGAQHQVGAEQSQYTSQLVYQMAVAS